MDATLVMLVSAVIIGLVPAIIASSKGRSFFLWWLYGTLIFIVAIIHAIIIKSEDSDVGGRVCPFCAERIKAEAIVCKHCGRESEPQVSTTTPPTFDVAFFVLIISVIAILIATAAYT